jgi:protein involved in polysaccharide export with SLBB domain
MEAGALEGNVDPGQYVLGPGDVLAIGFWGDANRSETVFVNPDGDAIVPPVGPIHVAGLTLAEARGLISEKLRVYYRPSVLSISLVSVRSFQVHVVGMVKKPGALEANAVTRVSQVIARAQGLAEAASGRNIRLIRGQDTLRVDLSRYLLLGDNKMNPFVRDGDVVYVPPRYESVPIWGSVYREGLYEFTEGETLGEIIELAGGLRPEALTDSVEVQRFRADDPASSQSMVLALEPTVLGQFTMAPGDRVFVRSVAGWHRDAEATIRGEVEHPGIYVIDDGGETLSQLIARAGGLTEKASLAEARLVRGLYASRHYPVEVMLDSLRIAEGGLSDKDLSLAQTLAREPKGAVSINFESLYAVKGRRLDLPLYDGDVIDIPRASLSVRVSGSVRNPGLVAFKRGESASYYIKQAGGSASRADVRGTRVVTAVSGQTLGPSGTEIRPGDIVWVPQRKDVSWWAGAKNVLELLVQVATIYIVVHQITTK